MRSVVVFVVAFAGACGPSVPGSDGGDSCESGQTRCLGNEFQTCESRHWATTENCTSPTPTCDDNLGCVACAPNRNYCADSFTVRSCDSEGNPGEVVDTCEGGETCINGRCASPCADAEASNSYIGCRYWAVPTSNSSLDAAFANNFGVVVSNGNNQPATVTISLGGSQVASQDIPANTVHEFELTLDTGLVNTDAESLDSQRVANAAYYVESSLPVTVYQFNPLDYEIGASYSYTNDASLLLPIHVLSGNYITMSRYTFGVDQCTFLGCEGYGFSPGFVTVVGTENNTTVTMTSSAYTQGGAIPAFTPGQTQDFTLNAGEAVQIFSQQPDDCSGETASDDCGQPGLGYTCNYCAMGESYDLTGTVIAATAPVAVVSGHNCSFVPFDTWACDHLEEMMLPLETWGKKFVVGRTEPQFDTNYTSTPEPNVIRVLSGADDNTITFRPAQEPGGTITLQQGEWREFMASADFEVEASEAVMIAQYVVGQNYYTDDFDYHGDPAYALMVPTEQFRTQYNFLAPSTMTYSYVNVTKEVAGAPVLLDGVEIPASEFGPAVGSTGYGVARLSISGTSHSIESDDPFGIVVYGFASYTSYMYPGGLDLEFINPIE